MFLRISGGVTRAMLPVFLTTLLLSACAAKDDADNARDGMTISVSLRDVHRCSRISPEIQISGIPPGTTYFDVRLVEYGDEENFFGGGSWPNDGTNTIPEGGLTRHYRGPCPPAGQSRDYAFVVSAMGGRNIQPLAVRLHRFTQE